MSYRVSDAVIRRLPGYYRHLRELEEAGVRQISSAQLGMRLKTTASQVRQDIACFGRFGQPGAGYGVTDLKRHIGAILGLDREHRMVIIGAGNIGRAVANYPTFKKNGFITAAVFDANPEEVGRTVAGLPVRHFNELETFLDMEKIDIGILSLPSGDAQQALELLTGKGVLAIWNFAPVDLKCDEDAVVVNVHLSESLQILSYKMHAAART